MTSFGEDLRLERERQNLSLEDLSAQTKINSRLLAALEAGDYSALPGGVFRKGIVRACLAALALDEHSWLPRFSASYDAHALALGRPIQPDEAAWATFAANVKRGRASTSRSNPLRWLGVAALLFLLAVAAWAAWHFQLKPRLKL